MEPSDKLDRIDNMVTELRVSMATLSGDLRAVRTAVDGHGTTAGEVDRRLRAVESTGSTIPPDVEVRLRTLERRLYGIPSVAAVLGLAGFALALWVTFRPH